jgi:hypothetical protein
VDAFMHAGRSNCPENRGVSPIEIAHVLAALANILGEKKPCKNSADLHPRQGNLLQWNIFTGLNKTSLYFTK